MLKQRGYPTGGFVAAFMLNAQSGLNRGFDAFDDEFGAAASASAFLAEHQRRAGEVERRAGEWIERAARGDRPFFAWVHFYDPHSPYTRRRPRPRGSALTPTTERWRTQTQCSGGCWPASIGLASAAERWLW